MTWTEPTTDKQKKCFSTYAPVIKLFAFLLWAWLIIWAIMDYKGFETLFSSNLGSTPLARYQFPVTVAVLAVLHISLLVTGRTFLFAWLDNRFAETAAEKEQADRTHFPLLIPLAITGIMLFASQQGSHAILEGMVKPANITATTEADSKKETSAEAEKKQLDYDLATIDALYNDLVKSTAKPYNDAIARYRRSIANLKWNEKARKSELLGQIRQAEQKRDEQTSALLNTKAVKQQNAMNRYESSIVLIDSSHKTATAGIEATNLKEREAEMSSRAAALRGSWVVSLVLAILFWATLLLLTVLRLKCGIRPERDFSEFDKSGGIWTWIQVAISDALKRQAFRFSVWLHTILSHNARELPKMDGRVSFTEPEDFDHTPTLPTLPDDDGDNDGSDKVRRMYPYKSSPAAIAINGNERPVTENTTVTVTAVEPVITKVFTDKKAQLAYHLQRIQIYHSKWKSPQGGATNTIISNLLTDWKAAFEIMARTPAEALGEQVERCHRLADMDFELFANPRPKDVQKRTA